jgi:hypothetical protein
MGGSAVQFPVAELDGDLVWAADAAAAGVRPLGLVCVGCAEPVVLRAGARNRPHFAHRAAGACGAGETVLHRTAVRVLADAILAAARARVPYPLEVRCDACQATKVGNLALRHDCDVVCDQVLADGIRPDVLVRSADGTPRTVLEVIVTHAPEPAAIAVYERLGLPVVSVWPTWETLAELRTGLVEASRRWAGNPDGLYDVTNYRCPLPRHRATDTPSSCPTCSGPVLYVSVEVAAVECYRCKSHGPPAAILDIVEHREPGLWVVAAGCEDLHGVDAIAEAAGVKVRMVSSKTANSRYLANHCGRGHMQGDNFVYSADGTVDLAAPVQHLVVCEEGHWSPVGPPRRWPAGARAERVRPAVGLVGNRAGLFGDDDSEDGQGLVRVEEVTRRSSAAIARRFVYGSGGGW